jgi:hypothetical protein
MHAGQVEVGDEAEIVREAVLAARSLVQRARDNGVG